MFSHPHASLVSARIRAGAVITCLLTFFTLLLAACGGGANPNATGSNALVVGQIGDNYVDNFNPYSTGGAPGGELIYESLLFANQADSKDHPWLATNYSFSSDNKQLTFTLHDNVKWNDGQPFSANDVVFTFNLMKQYPGMDVSNVWKYLSSVVAPNDHTVVFTFKTPNTPMLWYLGRLQLLPQHVWSKVGDPLKYLDAKPVGTGPYMLKTFDSQQISLTKNPNYWQPGKPKVAEIKYPLYKSNDILQLQLFSNRVDWAGIFAVNLDKNFVQKDPTNHHYWFAPTATVMFYVNQAKKPFNQLPVRQAISLALDREQMSKVAENGYEQVANPTALILPNAKDYLAPEYANLTFQRDTAKAQQVLEQAGYKKGSDGIYVAPDGTKLSFKINVSNSSSDWIRLCEIASQNLKDVGIDAAVNSLSSSDWYNDKQLGQYDITIDSDGGGLTPYYYYNRTLNSKRSAPIGTQSLSNFARWQDPTTDQLLNTYTTTSDPNVQKQAIQGIEKIYVEQLPTIPLLDAPTWFEYNSMHFSGWPGKDNPYASPDANEQIVLNLQPR